MEGRERLTASPAGEDAALRLERPRRRLALRLIGFDRVGFARPGAAPAFGIRLLLIAQACQRGRSPLAGRTGPGRQLLGMANGLRLGPVLWFVLHGDTH
jgi:hypothetical protein